MKILNLFIFLILISHKAYSIDRSEQRTWLGLFANKSIHSEFNLWAETQLRHDDSHQTMNQTLNRFGLIRKLSGQHEVGFLFAYVQSDTAKEYRPTFQYTYKFENDSTLYSIRNRLEFRDVEQQEANSMRWRTLFRWARPMAPSWDLLIWDEPFLNITHEEWTGQRVFERNRVFLGTVLKWEEIKIEFGYLNQLIPRENKTIQEHTLVGYLFF